ncbi:TGT-domain-containing protein [Polyplosphaeria fusca]|uniref:TGT-domain-containing protein n=1 Tax=Polyplosphaeria fusca TaxID=682080 RepID=A0A9P4UXS2_9PLEO|nr:TGT-domain-containing protein [Polyplosphaeria fusca]
MVSLLKLAQVTEEGVRFLSPHDGSPMLLTPEHSISLQNSIGSDIIMQLDDVIATTSPDLTRMTEAMHRSVRWLDRCMQAHKYPDRQNLFCIIQGGLDLDLRRECTKEMVARDTPGIAIGGLSGGEEKNAYCKVVDTCTELLPEKKPRYVMGVGYPEDLVVSVALGADMFDCVWPTRTARFGNAITARGVLNLRNAMYAEDFSAIEEGCGCICCRPQADGGLGITRAYMYHITAKETAGAHLLTMHNVHYQLNLMKQIREAILADQYPGFVRDFFGKLYDDASKYPSFTNFTPRAAQRSPAPAMEGQPQHAQPNSNRVARPPRQSTNNDANLLTHSLKRLSLHAAANTPLPSSPGINSPRYLPDNPRLPSSPGVAPSPIRRSSSVMSLNRSASPALGRKSSTSSLRGDLPGTPRASVSRRPSYNPNMPSPIGSKSPIEEKRPLRACDVAEEHFKKELALHEGVAGAATAGTVVIIHDQCYGHRWSRPKTAKTTLSNIVERPERILASVLGISAAYVRLGERHCNGSNPPHPDRNPSERIPFKIRKTARAVDLTSQVVTNVHGIKWMDELKTMCQNAERKLASTGKELSREGPTVPGQPRKENFHDGDLYLCAESLNAIQGALGGVLDAVDSVFQGTSMGSGPSRAFVCVRPPGHHCSADWPSGFCWINNVHVGIEHAIMQYGLTHAAIIDFDLHHGDGSQKITWARNKKVQNMPKNTSNAKKPSIGYFSLHDINSFPCEYGEDDKVQAASLCIDNAHGQSIWNVHLEGWRTPEEFWQKYEQKYLVLLEKTRAYLKLHTTRLRSSPSHPSPKAAIFLSAGFDASEWETEGMQRHKVNVPTEFYARFTRDVVRLAEEEGTSVDGRIISVLEGGYSDRALSSGVLSHISGLCDGQIWSQPATNGLAQDMRQRLGGLSMHEEDVPMQSTESEVSVVAYDPQWWHEHNLLELETLVNPPPAAAPKKPVRTGPPPTYSSPTQSFTAKVVDPSKLHRTTSGKFSASPSRAPTPPPPEVDWATASHALSKLLIPSNRQTRSHKYEDLSEPKVKKEKAPPVPISVPANPSGRQLRGRKPITSYADDSGDDTARVPAVSKANRRQTIADLPLASAESIPPTRSASRRMSIASSTASINGDTSMSRASSVVPGRRSITPAPATANGVQVKKARGSTAASRIPKNEPPVPRVPSGYLNNTTLAKGKENDDMDELTSGLKRVTLKLNPKNEAEAKQLLEAEKKAAKPATRKAAAPRTTKAATKVPGPKKAPGRPPKSSKPPSPVEPALLAKPAIPTMASPPQAAQIEHVAAAPLVQPQPVQFAQPAPLPNAEDLRRQSMATIDPPTELAEMSITPDQLPRPLFTTLEDPISLAVSPARPDTPPPPPPSNIPHFVNYTATSFMKPAPTAMDQVTRPEPQASLQWLPPTAAAVHSHAVAAERPLSPASKRQDLPTFTSNGMIPFAPNTGNSVAATVPPSVPTSQFPPAAPLAKTETHERDIWDVPETPAR